MQPMTEANATSPRLTTLPAWQALKTHYAAIKTQHMRDLFAAQPGRFEAFSIEWQDLFLDYSKNRITPETLRLLIELADACGLRQAIERMFSGEHINNTEDRAVLHTALRGDPAVPFKVVDEGDVMPKIKAVLAQMEAFCNRVHTGEWRGYSGKRIRAIVNIGIGGSDLGPRMVVHALRHYHVEDMAVHFVSNVDDGDIAEVLRRVDPETTLFIVSSKTFTTQETLANAHTARDWLLASADIDSAVAHHFVAVSTNIDAAMAFGVGRDNIFEFWDWVGGRYSLWSAIGLSIALAVGMQRFAELLAGARAMDQHFRNAPLEVNIPVVLGLLGIWYNDFFNAQTHAIIPYDQYLSDMPAYLQQADMESNGKRVTREGKVVNYATGQVIWGMPGTNGQHAFFQLLHQGTRLIPADFLAPVESLHNLGDHHRLLISNFLAQTEALVRGKTVEEAQAELEGVGMDESRIRLLLPHKVFPGNQPTNTLFYQRLTPYNLGALIAMYEHKIFVQGVIWDLNSFDQWGVELGKRLATRIYEEIQDPEPVTSHGQSTRGLINYFKRRYYG